MADRPDTLPTWATGGAAVVGTIEGSDRTAGYAFKQKLAYERLNAHFNELGDWVGYLDDHFETFPRASLLEMTAGRFAMVDGELKSDGSSVQIGRRVENVALALVPATVVALAANGQYVFAASASTVYAIDVSAGVAVWSWTRPGGNAIVDICCDSYSDGDNSTKSFVYVAYGDDIQQLDAENGSDTLLATASVAATAVAISCWNRVIAVAHGSTVSVFDEDLVSSFDYAHGDVVNDVAVGPDAIYAVGEAGGGFAIQAFPRTSATPFWQGETSDELFCVCTDGRRVYAAGQEYTYCWGAKARIAAATAAPYAWRARHGTVGGFDPSDICTDGQRCITVFLGNAVVFDGITGIVSAFEDPDSGIPTAITADYLGVYLGGDSMAWDGGASGRVARISVGAPARLVRRHVLSAAGQSSPSWPFPQLLIPQW